MVGPHGLEVAMHVGKLADVAWNVRERHREHAALEKELELEHVETEDALAKERLENERLRAALVVYENALQKELERQGSAETLEESLHLSRESSLDVSSYLLLARLLHHGSPFPSLTFPGLSYSGGLSPKTCSSRFASQFYFLSSLAEERKLSLRHLVWSNAAL